VKIPFTGGAYQAKSLNLNAQTCVNWYPEFDPHNAKMPYALYPTPGCKQWYDSTLGNGNEVRGMHVVGDYLYAVIGNSLYKLNSSASNTTITGNLTNSSGHVWMEDCGTYLMIVEPGVEGHTHTIGTATISAISDTDFPTPGSLTFQDGYFIVVEDGTDTIYISSLNDPTSWDALDYGSAEARPDDAKCAISQSHQLWILGDETTEVFYNSGDADFPFERITGAVYERGIGARDSVARLDNTLFWLDESGRVVRMANVPEIISTRHIEYQFSQYDVSDAIAWGRVQEGHAYYDIVFPTSNASWSYDASTQMWHRKSSFPNLGSTNLQRHRSNCYAKFAGKHLVGDYDNGKIYELDKDTYKDDSYEIRRERKTQYIHNERKKFFVNRLEIEFESGIALEEDDSDTETGTDPLAMLRWSDDGAKTWSNIHSVSLGQIGETKNRAIWRALGGSRNRIFELSVSDPVNAVIIDADANITLGIS